MVIALTDRIITSNLLDISKLTFELSVLLETLKILNLLCYYFPLSSRYSSRSNQLYLELLGRHSLIVSLSNISNELTQTDRRRDANGLENTPLANLNRSPRVKLAGQGAQNSRTILDTFRRVPVILHDAF